MRKTLIVLLITLFGQIAFCQQSKVITTDDGLSSSLIIKMYQDSYGIVWLGTENGLNGYDGMNILSYKKDDSTPGSICNSLVRAIIEDNEGHLIIGTAGGIQIYERESGTFSDPLCDDDGVPYLENVNRMILRRNGEVLASGNRMVKILYTPEGKAYVSSKGIPSDLTYTLNLLEDRSQNIWASKYGEGILRYSPNGNISRYTVAGASDVVISSLAEGGDGRIYVGTNRDGINVYNPDTDEFEPCNIPEAMGTIINCMYDLGNGTMCVGTDSRGALIVDYGRMSTSRLEIGNCPFDPDKLKIHDMLRDSEGNIWLGAYQKGAIMVPERTNNFTYIGSKSVNSDFIGSCYITSLAIDRNGSLWVGTDNDGIYRINRRITGKEKGGITHFPALENGITETVMDITEDSKGYIWFGTYAAGLHRLDPRTGRAVDSSTLTGAEDSNISVYSIAEDSDGRLWLGTMGDGIFNIDLATMRKNPLKDLNNNINLWVNDILVSDKEMFAACFGGIYRIDTDGPAPAVRKHYIEDRICYCLYKTGDLLYAGTASGISIINLKDDSVVTYTKSEGLCDNTIYGMLEGDDGRIWISTSYGMSAFDPKDHSFNNYYVGDGLQSNEFTRGAAAAYHKIGALFFGGAGGVTWFYPRNIVEAPHEWNVRITSIKTPDRTIYPFGKDRFDLKYKEKSATVEFCTAEFGSPNGILYSYRIDNGTWTTLTSGNHSVTLGDLRPGEYSFEVKAVDNGVECAPTKIHIKVAHAWWNCALAKFGYALLILGILLISFLQERYRVLERRETEKHKQAEEAKEAKLSFFTNLSHEIRSPMTLIEGPLQTLMENDKDPERQKSYNTMSRNAKRILQLINQMLDMQKLDEGQLKLHFCETDLNSMVSDICDLFREQTERKGIRLDFRYSGAKIFPVWLDPNQFDKVIVNLLSNAVKYTPEGGEITVSTASKGGKAIIEVCDNGPGMDEADLQKIFDRFYQSGAQASGTGIGLNLVHLLVQNHHGTIRAANNQDGPGCTFTVELPLGNAHLTAEEIEKEVKVKPVNSEDVPDIVPQAVDEGPDHAARRKRVMIVEDDVEIRQYLHTQLARDFYIEECSNGKEALDSILKKTPDLVISDVMMPEMDGFTLCRKIRRNININSVPVILLTAKASDEDRIEGMDTGADAYISKPFNVEVLRKTALNLIGSRERLKVVYNDKQTENVAKVDTIEIKSPDEKLLARVDKVINANISNPKLTVEQIAAEVGISRVHLHRKLTELTNQTTRDYVRNLRLNKAAEMLSEKKHAISEVSDAVGFSNPANFATAFKELFGVSPSEYKAHKGLSEE